MDGTKSTPTPELASPRIQVPWIKPDGSGVELKDFANPDYDFGPQRPDPFNSPNPADQPQTQPQPQPNPNPNPEPNPNDQGTPDPEPHRDDRPVLTYERQDDDGYVWWNLVARDPHTGEELSRHQVTPRRHWTEQGNDPPNPGNNDHSDPGPYPPGPTPTPNPGGNNAYPTSTGYGGPKPILLDLAGTGINIDEVTRSNTFIDAQGSGLLHRTAWAGAGTGVLFFDPKNLGAIQEKSQYVFTEWDPTAKGDLEALRSVFDSNGDGVLDAQDAKLAHYLSRLSAHMCAQLPKMTVARAENLVQL
jgi:hypothetical protein